MLARIFNRRKKQPDPFTDLNRELRILGSKLQVTSRTVRWRNRQCQVFGSYVDFWENGIKWLGVDLVDDVRKRAKLIYYWCELCLNSDEIERRVPGVEFPRSRKMIERGEAAYLKWYWNYLQEKNDNRFGELIELLASNEKTSRLMSFFHLRDFGLSRNIGEVNGTYCHDLPKVRIRDDWKYEVHLPNMGIVDRQSGVKPSGLVGAGNAHEVFKIILQYLPGNVGTAGYFRCDGCPPQPAA